MDGSFAVLTIVLGLWDMYFNHCPTTCLARQDQASYLTISNGSLWQHERRIGTETYIRLDTGRFYGPFELTYGASLSSLNDLWGGAGVIYDIPTRWDNAFFKLHAMGGLYAPGDGPPLGGPIEFRSGIEAGWVTQNGWRYAWSLDHRSSAGIYPSSIGVETFMFRLSIPF